LKQILKIAGTLISIFFISFLFIWFKLHPTFFDYPYHLSEKEETIELMYVAWACDCAEWAKPSDVKQFSDNPGDTLSKLSIFIEAAQPELKIPEAYKIGCCGNRIRFTGRFYMDKGIGRDYGIQFEKPDKARVFRYTKFELIKPYTAWDFDAPDSSNYKIKLIR
jgi:hypothetical protein